MPARNGGWEGRGSPSREGILLMAPSSGDAMNLIMEMEPHDRAPAEGRHTRVGGEQAQCRNRASPIRPGEDENRHAV